MKLKIQPLIFLFLLSFTVAIPAHAWSPITGTAYGQNIGLLHFNYCTAKNPWPACNMQAQDINNKNCPINGNYNNYHLGVRKDFYISETDPAFVSSCVDQLYPAGISGYSDAIGSGGVECNKTTKECELRGYMWSDAIGWIMLGGRVLRERAFGNNSTSFPDDYIARVSYDPAATKKGVFKGFIWSENAGWIALSSASGPKQSGSDYTTSDQQDSTDWGVWMSTNGVDCESLNETNCKLTSNSEVCEWSTSSSTSCVYRSSYRLHGNAWSEKLGWIKFDKGASDDVNFGAYTTWFPDTTPPVVRGVDKSWFANTSPIGTVFWNNFAEDKQSGIDLTGTSFLLTPAITGCPSVPVTASKDIATGKILNLEIGGAALIPNTLSHCKYSLTGTIRNGAGLDTTIGIGGSPTYPTYTFFTRAGALDPTKSSITPAGGVATVVADGNAVLTYNFAPKDIAGNAIVSVKVNADGSDATGTPANWRRTANTDFSFDSNFFYDAVNGTSTSIPANINGSGKKQDELIGGIWTAPSYTYSNGNYPILINAFAPTVGDNSFIFDHITFTFADALISAPSTTVPSTPDTPAVASTPITITSATALQSNSLGNPLSFLPAITTVSTDTPENKTIIVGGQGYTNFNIINNSPTVAISDYAIDNRITFSSTGTGYGPEVLEIADINLEGDNDNVAGKTDPLEIKTRYEIGTDSSPSDTYFHTNTGNYHDPNYNFSTNVAVNGSYTVSLGVPPVITAIDRTDVISGTLSANNSTSPSSMKINFGIKQIIGNAFTQSVTLSTDQYIAYKAPSALETAIYDQNLFSDYTVKNVGLQASGIVSGKNVYDVVGGRDFESISSSSSATLKTQIRSNVAELSRNIVDTNCTLTGGVTLSSLTTTPGNCVKVDSSNKTVVAIYSGTEGQLLTIGDPTHNDITIPDGYRYTIIVKGGANVLLNSNLKYASNTSSFGLIVLADNTGKGGNVYLAPEPTNMVGLLYAEGSLMSRASDGKLYYGPSPADSKELNNQLFWQGSIVSKNTIGGAPNKQAPQGIECGTDYGCAQLYDMDYLRRFYPVDGLTEGKFSGGGTCNATTCSNGTLPTTITLDGSSKIDTTNSKSIDPFYIEKTNRPAPLGFTTGGGFTQSQEIRN